MLQEQFKFVYDTLEEYVVCGTSFFYVQELSERLKAKSLKDKQTKKHPNEYEKEYSVSHPLCMLTTNNLGNEGSPLPSSLTNHTWPWKYPAVKPLVHALQVLCYYCNGPIR